VPKRERVLAVAHRGDPVGQRENTLEAFMSAKALGADMVELDCRLTRDGEVVVLHDPTLERLWGVHKAVSELDWADVSRIQHGCYRIPLFAEVLDATDLPIMVDLPEASAAVPSYNLALAAGAVGRCYFAGNLAGLCEVRNRSASANIALTWDKPELPNQQLISALKPQWWNPYHWLASPRAVEWAHSSGMAVSTWTVDSARDIKRALAAGVDAVISNQVALLVSHLKPAG
jgi:glycerophosphoryl diester phosphodiesterase